MDLRLDWPPAAGNNIISQDIQYKKASSSTWITATTATASTSSYTITGLDLNTIYNFRIVANCTYGGPTPTASTDKVIMSCPTVSITPSYATTVVNITPLAGGITSYKVDLLDSTGNTVIATKTANQSTSTIQVSFDSLTPSTNYNIRVTAIIDSNNQNVCANNAFSTSAAPSCPAPSSLTVTLVEN